VDVARPQAGDDADEGCESEEANAAEPVKVKPPVGYVEMTVAGVVGTEGGNAVVLVDAARTLGIPVFIGGTEAMSIQLRLEGRKYQRPLTHDLLDAIVDKLGGRIVAVRVDSIENDVFIGAVLVQRGKRISEIDSRVSDALALAIGNRAPIYVAKRVLDKSGVDVQKLGINPGETAHLEAP
jgi:bifunctional DNase/RNase